MPNSLRILAALGLLALVGFAAVSCAPPADAPVTPTPDYVLLETRTEERLAARLTAQAPPPTPTATPTPAPPTATPAPTVPAPTATPTPAATAAAPFLVYVQRLPNDVTQIVAPGVGSSDNGLLTHFPEPLSIDALVWSKEGDWLAFASSHAFIRSHANERNIFVMRPDGSDLRMITGDYMDPANAPGPYLALQGTVEGGQGICRVIAQGATSPVETDADRDYGFVITGVSQTATWARAICQDGVETRQGDVALDLQNGNGPITIVVAERGQGWRDVSLAPGGLRMVGTHYEWQVDEEGVRRYVIRGGIYDVETDTITWLEMPEGMSFYGADWSFDGARIVGGLSDEDGAYLWQWNDQGQSIGALLSLDNPEDEILSIVRPRWSPRDTGIVFELHRWYWWGDPRYRTDLMLLLPGDQEPTALVASEWGDHATHPAWAGTGMVVFYQHTSLEGDLGPGLPLFADIWAVPIEDRISAPWSDDGASYLPAIRPVTGFP
jgi:hypothetical protein